ncbi:hypothetical protein D1872_294340 [compost metagenome]
MGTPELQGSSKRDGVSNKVGGEAIREAICEVTNLSFGANGANHKGIPGVITMTGNALFS